MESLNCLLYRIYVGRGYLLNIFRIIMEIQGGESSFHLIISNIHYNLSKILNNQFKIVNASIRM